MNATVIKKEPQLLELFLGKEKALFIKKGTTIFSPEAGNSKSIYLIKKGYVRLFKLSQSGKMFTADILGTGAIFGETSSFLLHSDDLYAESITDLILYKLSKAEFENLLKGDPHFALKYITVLTTRIKDTYSTSEIIATRSVKARLIYLFIKLGEQYGVSENKWTKIDVKLTHQDIAAMIGATRETTSLFLNQLKKEGLIKKEQFWKINQCAALEYVDFE